MCCSSQSYPGLNLGKLLVKSGVLLAGLFLTQVSLAASSPTPGWPNGPETLTSVRTFWIIAGVLGCVGIAGGGFLARKLRQNRLVSVEPTPGALKTAAVPAGTAGLKLNGSRQFKFQARPKTNKNGSNGKTAIHNNAVKGRGRRTFNYHKFYTEMVLQGPAPVIGDSYNGYEQDSLRFGNNGHNGNGNGHANGNGHTNGHQNGNSGNGHSNNGDSSAVLNAHSELIATQRGLIEEQKRLIQEQARLIEEKEQIDCGKEPSAGETIADAGWKSGLGKKKSGFGGKTT